jgi:hypothetical protein
VVSAKIHSSFVFGPGFSRHLIGLEGNLDWQSLRASIVLRISAFDSQLACPRSTTHLSLELNLQLILLVTVVDTVDDSVLVAESEAVDV